MNKLSKLIFIAIFLFVPSFVFGLSYFIFSNNLNNSVTKPSKDSPKPHPGIFSISETPVAKLAIVEEVLRDEKSLILSDINNAELTTKVSVNCLGHRAELKVFSDGKIDIIDPEAYIFDNISPGDQFRYVCDRSDCTSAVSFCSIVKSSK